MPAKQEGLNEPAGGGSPEATNASTAAPDAEQTAGDRDEPCSCCAEMMGAMFKAKRSSGRSAT